MKNLFAIFAIAAMAVSCAGNANKPAEVVIDSTAIVVDSTIVDSAACDSVACDSTATAVVK